VECWSIGKMACVLSLFFITPLLHHSITPFPD
jgi:hypothetical protein